MNESLRCPPGEKLRLLVLAPDRLDLAETQRLEAHVESCDDCKTKLEGMDFLDEETAPLLIHPILADYPPLSPHFAVCSVATRSPGAGS
jgi:hypothetical protein